MDPESASATVEIEVKESGRDKPQAWTTTFFTLSPDERGSDGDECDDDDHAVVLPDVGWKKGVSEHGSPPPPLQPVTWKRAREEVLRDMQREEVIRDLPPRLQRLRGEEERRALALENEELRKACEVLTL